MGSEMCIRDSRLLFFPVPSATVSLLQEGAAAVNAINKLTVFCRVYEALACIVRGLWRGAGRGLMAAWLSSPWARQSGLRLTCKRKEGEAGVASFLDIRSSEN